MTEIPLLIHEDDDEDLCIDIESVESVFAFCYYPEREMQLNVLYISEGILPTRGGEQIIESESL